MLNESFPLCSGRTGPPDTKNVEGRLGDMGLWTYCLPFNAKMGA